MSKSKEEFEKSLLEYNQAFQTISALLDKASAEYKIKGLSTDELSILYGQVGETGSLAHQVLGNVIGFGKYQDLFRMSYEFLRECLKT